MTLNKESLNNVRPLSLANIIQKNPFTDTEADRFAAKSAPAGLPDDFSASLLLSTKMELPQIRTKIVERPRLLMKINQIRHKKLILVTAPAGFGKTTLLSTWASQTVAHDPVAWVSLDQGDNIPARFWLYVIYSIQRSLKLTDLLPENLSPLETDFLLTQLINRLDGYPQHFTLVLDDLHLIDNPTIYGELAKLLDRMPGFMHLILSGRVMPPLSVSRLRASGELLEIGMEDIRFTDEESEQFLQDSMGLKLSAPNLKILSSRTEGWIAGLQMTAISLQGNADISRWIESFTGSDRYILDYLMEEVLRHQPESIREFLMKTSVLSRMTGALCDALLQNQDSWNILERLEKDNLFIIALDRERQWYRYHHLFSEFLRNRLEKEYPTKLGELHQRASRWFEEQGLLEEAIEHAIDAFDFKKAVSLMEKVSHRMFDYGEENKLNSWLEKLPRETLLQKPRLALYHAYVLVLQDRRAEAEPWLATMEKYLTSLNLNEQSGNEEDALEQQDLVVELNLIKTMKAGMERDVKRTVTLAKETLDALAKTTHVDPIRARWIIEFNQGYAYLECRMLEHAHESFVRAYNVCQASNTAFYGSVVSLDYLARVQYLQGKLNDAVRTDEEILRLSEGKINFFSWAACRANLSLGSIYYVWDDLTASSQYLKKAIVIGESIGDKNLMTPALLGLLRIARIHNDPVQTKALEAKVNEILLNIERPDRLLQAFLVQYQLSQGRPDQTLRWLESRIYEMKPPLEFPFEMELLTASRALMALHRWDEALEILSILRQNASENSMLSVLAESIVLQSICLDRSNQRPEMVFASLKQGLEIAANHCLIRTLIDEGEPIRLLWCRFYTEVIDGRITVTADVLEYLTRLLHQERAGAIPTEEHSSSSEHFLSEREIEILRYIASGLSNQEIAKLLFIADGTVKKHLSNIFAKLQVHSRTKAIATARQSGII
jgi:LuxR family maltose regulon positive regulatory protein